MVEREQVMNVLRSVFDPEIPINVVDLGLVYGIDIDETGDVHVRMTMTAPQCPMSGYLVQQVDQAIRTLSEVHDVKVDLVFDPPWDPSMIKMDALKNAGFVSDTSSPSADETPGSTPQK